MHHSPELSILLHSIRCIWVIYLQTALICDKNVDLCRLAILSKIHPEDIGGTAQTYPSQDSMFLDYSSSQYKLFLFSHTDYKRRETFFVEEKRNICNNFTQTFEKKLTAIVNINPLNPELNPICYLLALLGAHHFFHVSRIRVKSLTFRRLMSYIYGAPILDVSRSHTTTQHSR